MGQVSPEIAAKQAAYAAKPFFAYVSSRYFSGGFRFDSMAEAIDYLRAQALRRMAAIAAGDFDSMDMRRSYVEGPGWGKVPARYVLFIERIGNSGVWA